MRICSICQSVAELDDVVLTLSIGGCICLRCFCRETDSIRHMPASLRRAVEEVLTESAILPGASPVPSLAGAMNRDAASFPRDWKPWWQTLRGSA